VPQEYRKIQGKAEQQHVASQADCDRMVADSGNWFTEDDICQFMNRREEDCEELPPTEE
jgi:hypothetical protein